MGPGSSFLNYLLCCLCMNTRDTSAALFQGTPNVRRLFGTLFAVVAAWVAARRARRIDFHELTEEEITPEMRKRIDAARNAPEEDFVNI